MELSTELKSHFLRLYEIAISDGTFSSLELKMLYDFAEIRGISKEYLDKLLLNPKEIEELIPENITDKIEYLYDFSLMILADGVISIDEKNSLIKYIISFGFLEENANSLAEYLLKAVENGKSKQELIDELKK